MSKLKMLRDERASVVREGEAVVAQYTGEDRDPTKEEIAALEALAAKRDDLDARIEAAEHAESLAGGFVTVRDSVSISGGNDRIEDDPKRGFASFRDFAATVMASSKHGGGIDPRLSIGAAPTTYGNESSGADGGFLVPVEFASTILSDSFEDDALLPSTDSSPISGNSMAFPADEDAAWNSGGIQAYWEGEADQATQSKPALDLKTLRLKRLTALVPLTDELVADATAAGSYVEGKAGAAIRWKTNDALVNGDGVGKPQGVVGHAGTVSVAKEGAQTAATVVIENVVKMYSRAINPARSTWIANIATFPQIFDMKDNSGNRVYQTTMPGMPANMDGILLGRPLRWVEACPDLGTVGDLIFGDWQQYKTITKSGGIETATSMHLWFDYNVTAFRLTFRVDGQPWRGTTLSPGKGSNTRGNFVTVATRA